MAMFFTMGACYYEIAGIGKVLSRLSLDPGPVRIAILELGDDGVCEQGLVFVLACEAEVA
jgi:hypothetical protein